MLCGLIACGALSAQAQTPDEKITALQQQLGAAGSDSVKAELAAMIAEQRYYNSYKLPDDAPFRTAELSKALEQITRSMALYPREKWRPFQIILRLELARYAPTGEAVKSVGECKKDLDFLLEKYPNDVPANVAFGAMAYDVTHLGGLKQFLAGIFYGKLPEGLSYQTALLHLLVAKQHDATMPIIYFKLAETYFALRNNRDAFASLYKCIELPEKYPYIDAYFKSLAQKLLAEQKPLFEGR